MQQVIDLAKIERDIEIREPPQALRPIDYAPPKYRDALPDYVQHSPGVPRIGALSAAAVARMHEEAALAIEAMGEEQQRLVERCEEVIAGAHSAMAEAKAFAEHCRQEGRRAFAAIEGYAKLTSEVNRVCAELQERISTEANEGSV